MQVEIRGHRYLLDQIGSDEKAIIEFVNKEPGMEKAGVTTQEILRVLIDRTHYCHNCLPHRVNEQIIWHFRMGIALHEARALEQRVAKSEVLPEVVVLAENGHFALGMKWSRGELEETALNEVPKLGDFQCDHRSNPNA